jgi:hypothetical protein
MTPTGQRDSKPVPSQEDRLLDLLRKAEGYAYALAHGYDIGGQPDRAYALVALGERIRDTATDLSDLARPIEPHSAAPASGLRWRAFSLRRLLKGTAWQGSSVAPLVPQLASEQTERVHSGRSQLNLTEFAKRVFGFGKDASRRVRDACRHPTRQPTKVMPSKLTREDAAHGDDAAKRQEEGACGKKPGRSLSAPGILSEVCPNRLVPSRQIVGCRDRLLVQLSN